MGKIEPQPVRTYKRSGLLDMLPKDLSERPVEDVCGTMMSLNCLSVVNINGNVGCPSDSVRQGTLDLVQDVPVVILCGIKHWHALLTNSQCSGVAHLATHFRITGSPVENDKAVSIFFHHIEDGCLDTAKVVLVVANELSRFHRTVFLVDPDDTALTGCAGAGALRIHFFLETGNIHIQTLFTCNDLRQVQRESVRIIQCEGIFSTDM